MTIEMNLQKGLVGHWTMDSIDVDSDLVRDKSGYENHATYSAIPNFPGISGDSFSFDGNEVVDYRPFKALVPSEGFSAGLFAYVSDNQPRGLSVLFHNGSYSNLIGWVIEVNENGSAGFNVGDNSSFNGVGSSASIPLNEFVHIFGTYEPSTSTTKIYIDGDLESEDNVNQVPSTRDELTIGCRASFRTRYFRGKASDARIYNRVLSADEVKQLSNIRSDRSYGSPYIPEKPVAASNLVAWYPFEGEASDATAFQSWAGDDTDYSGTVNGATKLEDAGVNDIRLGSGSGVYDFDNDNVEVSLPTFSELSASVWVNWDDLNTQYLGPFDTFGTINTHQFTFHDDGGDSGVLACLTPDGSFQFGSVSPNEWIHLLATYDGSTVTTYLNGSQANSGSASFSADLSEVGIGARFGDTSNVVTDGRIDDVRIYNRALTESEVSSIYNNTKP